MTKTILKMGYNFHKDRTLPFPMTSDQTIGILTEEKANDFIIEHESERITSRMETVTEENTAIIILQSENKRVAHLLDKNVFLEGATAIYISGIEKPTIVERNGEFFILSPLTEWEEEKEPHYANSPDKDHTQVRYHCASCRKRLEIGSDIYLDSPFNFWQTIIKPCSEHPDAGFYLIFAK